MRRRLVLWASILVPRFHNLLRSRRSALITNRQSKAYLVAYHICGSTLVSYRRFRVWFTGLVLPIEEKRCAFAGKAKCEDAVRCNNPAVDDLMLSTLAIANFKRISSPAQHCRIRFFRNQAERNHYWGYSARWPRGMDCEIEIPSVSVAI